MIALLSFASDTWQSLQVFVSFFRTVCGKWALKAWELKPDDEIGGCWM